MTGDVYDDGDHVATSARRAASRHPHREPTQITVSIAGDMDEVFQEGRAPVWKGCEYQTADRDAVLN
jgi:hypothetical protein